MYKDEDDDNDDRYGDFDDDLDDEDDRLYFNAAVHSLVKCKSRSCRVVHCVEPSKLNCHHHHNQQHHYHHPHHHAGSFITSSFQS